MIEGQKRDEWERGRTIAAIIIQPHVKKRITSIQLLPMPWDKTKKDMQQESKARKLTAEEKKKRFEEISGKSRSAMSKSPR